MSIINYKGYGLLKINLTKEKEKELITNLTVKPCVNPNYDFGLTEAYPVYRFNSERYYIPKFYGLKHYGPVSIDKINERVGQDIGLCRFRGILRDDQLGHVSELIKEIKTNGSCISNAATGSGKTTFSLYVLTQLKKKNFNHCS